MTSRRSTRPPVLDASRYPVATELQYRPRSTPDLLPSRQGYDNLEGLNSYGLFTKFDQPS